MIKPLFALAALLSTSALADTLVTNVNGMQVGADGQLQHFSGLLIGDDGKVIRTLGPSDAPGVKGPVVDGGGRTLLPGLIDTHGHVMELGFGALELDVTGTQSVQELQQRLKAYAARERTGWVLGRGWNQEMWPDKRFPSAADLNSIVSDRPVVLRRVDGHAMVVNGAALKAAGITAATADPAGGRIDRDSAGNPTGLLVDAAMDLMDKKIPSPSSAQRDRALAEAQRIMLGYGLVGAGDMGTSLEDWATMRRAGEAGKLQVRIMSYASGVEPLKTIRAPTAWLYQDRLHMGGVKLYADGALGSRGAWLKQPYSDKPDTRGLQFHSDAEILSLAETAAAQGFQVATHAIGDAANAQIIAIYEQLARKYPGDRRWRIEHFQILDPVDIPRLRPAGIIASMQPTHQTSDRLMAEARLGPDRLAGAYAWNTILQTGVHVPFGSDFPVESPNPFPGIAAAISREDMNGQPPGGWRPQERVSLATAISGFTREAAYAAFAENRIGSLEPGKWADFILIDRDPTAVDPQALARTQVLETWVGGKKAWSRAPSAVAAAPERGK